MAMISPRRVSHVLNGHSTEILIQTFADRVLVLVTQMGKVGTLVLPKLYQGLPVILTFFQDPSLNPGNDTSSTNS